MSKFILKKEINEERERNAEIFSVLHKKINVYKEENEMITTENIALLARFSRFKEILEDSQIILLNLK